MNTAMDVNPAMEFSNVPLHPMARRSIRTLQPPPPYLRYRAGWTERMFTNPFGGEFRTYPTSRPDHLQARYAAWLTEDLEHRGQSGRVTGELVMFTAGCVAGIELMVRAFCEPDEDAIVIQSPTFPIFAHHAHIENVRVVDVPLQGPDLNVLDLDAIVAANARLTFVCRPSNPVGTVPSFAQILELSQRLAGILVIDESYIEFCDLESATALLASNVVVLRTFSKAWGLAGVRAGAVVGPPSILNTLRVIADPFAFDTPAQNSVEDLLSSPKRALGAVEQIKRERDRMVKELNALPGVRAFPSATNFILLIALTPIFQTRPDLLMADFSAQLLKGVRISVSTPDENNILLNLVSGMARANVP